MDRDIVLLAMLSMGSYSGSGATDRKELAGAIEHGVSLAAARAKELGQPVPDEKLEALRAGLMQMLSPSLKNR